jgi:hypothetical protein
MRNCGSSPIVLCTRSSVLQEVFVQYGLAQRTDWDNGGMCCRFVLVSIPRFSVLKYSSHEDYWMRMRA